MLALEWSRDPIAPDTEVWLNLGECTAPQDGSETDVLQPSDLPLPGILTVTLFKGVALSVPDQYMGLLDDHQRTSLAKGDDIYSSQLRDSLPYHCQPYAVLYFDKLRVVVNACSRSVGYPLWGTVHGTRKFDVFRAAELQLRIYLKIAGGEGPDICIGSARVMPSVAMSTPSIKWLHLVPGTGKIALGLEYTATSSVLTFNDFQRKLIIGGRRLGGISLAEKRDTERLYALKRIRKSGVDSWSNVAHGLRFDIHHSFIAPLFATFRDEEQFCLLSRFASGGHLFSYLQGERRFGIAKARLYAAELTCAFKYLHDLDIVCQGLQPGNILLDSWGHLVVCDFSLHQSGAQARSQNSAQLLEYPAPELLRRPAQPHTKSVDWWTLGVFLYEMLTGMPPFYAEDTEGMHRNIETGLIHVPESLSTETKDLLLKLLNSDPDLRLGAHKTIEVKAHPFFGDIDWEKLQRRQLEPPFKPREVVRRFKHPGLSPDTDFRLLFKPSISARNMLLTEEENWKIFCPPCREGRLVRTSEGSLIHAVIKGDQDLARTLVSGVQGNDRVNGTKALSLAVEQRDKAMVRMLLDGGVNCDFQDSDRPSPPARQEDCQFLDGPYHDITEPEDFIPPLVRSVKLGDLDLVKMLLAAGADANVGFHDINFRFESLHRPMNCGRVLELAMALGHEEIVQLLLASEAYVDLPAPVWQHHDCTPVQRPEYLKITASLRQRAREHDEEQI